MSVIDEEILPMRTGVMTTFELLSIRFEQSSSAETVTRIFLKSASISSSIKLIKSLLTEPEIYTKDESDKSEFSEK